MKLTYMIALFLSSSALIFSQYALDPDVVYLPDQPITTESIQLPFYTGKEDVRYTGMGKTGIANGRKFNAMIYNPALLSRERFSIDGLTISFSFPPATYDAANYLNDHLSEFKDALSLKQLWEGVNSFNNAGDINEQLVALREIQEGLQFPRTLLQNVIGTPDDPITHGLRTIPSLAVQVGNFGFTIYGVGQSAFEVEQSPLLDALLKVPIPDDLNDPEQVYNAVLALQGLLQPVMNGEEFSDVLPFAYSISYVDITGALGYSYKITKRLSAGLNLKIIHRRFSAKKLMLEEYKDVLNILKRDLNQYTTGVTFDIGGLYSFLKGTDLGFSVQNVIPVKKITSVLTTDFDYTYLDYKRDNFGNIQLDARGDTILQSYSQTFNIGIPFDLKLPVVVNLGVLQAITENWDAEFDIADLADQDIQYEDYWSRFRLGTEYRLDVMPDKLGAAFRIGLADKRFTGGLGLNIFRALQVDGAYAYEDFIGTFSYYLQVRLGW